LFFEYLWENLQFQAKDVYCAAAEVCGLMLKQRCAAPADASPSPQAADSQPARREESDPFFLGTKDRVHLFFFFSF
jgi:hypothetical protein